MILFLSVTASAYAGKRGGSGAPASRPHKVILMIGDGLGLSQMTAMLTIAGDNSNLLMFRQAAFVRTQSLDDFITDSAASGTAMACGVKTRNGAIGVDSLGRPVNNIPELARLRGISSGLVAACAITHATPAAFVAHVPNRESHEDIAAAFPASGLDVFIGGGSRYFEKRKDGANLIDSLRARGYFIQRSSSENDPNASKIAGLWYPDHPPAAGKRGEMLPDATRQALELLSRNKKGFFLMVEGSQIDWACHDNSEDILLKELADFNTAIGIALEYAKQDGNTLVIVTADHETGAYFLKQGNVQSGQVSGGFGLTDHSGSMVPLLAFGPGAGNFSGILDNTSIFRIISGLLDINDEGLNR